MKIFFQTKPCQNVYMFTFNFFSSETQSTFRAEMARSMIEDLDNIQQHCSIPSVMNEFKKITCPENCTPRSPGIESFATLLIFLAFVYVLFHYVLKMGMFFLKYILGPLVLLVAVLDSLTRR